MGHGSGAVVRYFVFGADAHDKSYRSDAAARSGDLATSELDLVGSAVLHGCVYGPTKNPRGSFKHCIRIDFAKEYQPSLKPADEVSEHDQFHIQSGSFCRHKTPQKLVLCLTSESEKREWLQALSDALAMSESEQAVTTILLSALSRNTGKHFEQAVAKLVGSEAGDDKIRELLSDILTQLMGPTAVAQSPQLVRDGLNCIGTLVERMPNKMRSRAALGMFVPATIAQTDSPSTMVSQAALQVLATAVRSCKEHILPFFYGLFQAILRHIDSKDKDVRTRATSLNEALMKLTEIKTAREFWQKTLDRHLELILTARCDSEMDRHASASYNARIVRDAAVTQERFAAAAISKIMLELRFQWLELLIDKDKLDFSELGVSAMLPHAVTTLLDAAHVSELKDRVVLAAQVVKSMYATSFSIPSCSTLSDTDNALAQVLVSKTSADNPSSVRNLAFLFVANFFQLHAAAAFPYYAFFLKNVLTALPHESIPCARSVHDHMQKFIRGPPLLGNDNKSDLLALILAVTSHLDVCTHLECSDTLQWIILFNFIYLDVFLECTDTFLPPFMRLLVNCDGLYRLAGPEHPSSNPADGELRGCVPIAIELFCSLAFQQGSCVKLVSVLIDCLALLKSDALLHTTREVVGSLFTGTDLNPLEVFSQFCMQLQLKKSNRRFCHLMSHSLVSLLFVKPELHCLRQLLSNIGSSVEAAAFFQACFKGFASNPVALIALCLYARAYPLATVVIHSFANWELSDSFETEVLYVVRLLQGPTMQLVRYDLHGGSGNECRLQAWLALNALLAIMCVLHSH